MNNLIYRFIVFVCLLLSFQIVDASQLPDYYSEPGESDGRQAIGNEIDEIIDPYGGGLQLRYTDLTLPGPAGLDINVIRTYRNLPGQPGILGGDYLGTRGVHGLGWDIHFGRVWTEQSLASSTVTGCNKMGARFLL